MNQEDAHKYAPVLARMVEHVTSDDSIKFGAALDLAKKDLGMLDIPDEIQDALLIAAARIVWNGFETTVQA